MMIQLLSFLFSFYFAAATYEKILFSKGPQQLTCPNSSVSPTTFTKKQLGGSYSFDSQLPGFTLGVWVLISQDSFWSNSSPQNVFFFSSDLLIEGSEQQPLLAISVSLTSVFAQSLTQIVQIDELVVNKGWVYFAASVDLNDQSLELDMMFENQRTVKKKSQSSLQGFSEYVNAGIIIGKTPVGRQVCAKIYNFYLFKSTSLQSNRDLISELPNTDQTKIAAHFFLMANKPFQEQNHKNDLGGTVKAIQGLSTQEEIIFDPVFARIGNDESYQNILSNRKLITLEGVQLSYSLGLSFDYFSSSCTNDMLISSQSVNSSNNKLIQISQIVVLADNTMRLNITLSGASTVADTIVILPQQTQRITLYIYCSFLNDNSTTINLNVGDQFYQIVLPTLCFDFSASNGKLFIGSYEDSIKDNTFYKSITNLYIFEGNDISGMQSISQRIPNDQIIPNCQILFNSQTPTPECIKCDQGLILVNNSCKPSSECTLKVEEQSLSQSSQAYILGDTCLMSCANSFSFSVNELCQYQMERIEEMQISQIILNQTNSTMVIDTSSYSSPPQIFIAINSIIHSNNSDFYNFTLSASQQDSNSSTVAISFNHFSDTSFTEVGISYLISPSTLKEIETNVLILSNLKGQKLIEGFKYFRVEFKIIKNYIPEIAISVLSYESQEGWIISLQPVVTQVDYNGFEFKIEEGSGVVQLSYLAFQGMSFSSEYDFTTNDEHQWGEVPSVKTNRYLNTLNHRLLQSLHPSVQLLTFIQGISKSIPSNQQDVSPYFGVNISMINNTIISDKLRVDYLQSSYSSLNSFQTLSILIYSSCSTFACVKNSVDAQTKRGTNQLEQNSILQSGNGTRSVSSHINFEKFMRDVPNVFMILKSIRILPSSNNSIRGIGFELRADNISYDGFDIIYEAYDGIMIEQMGVEYIATTNEGYFIYQMDLSEQYIQAYSQIQDNQTSYFFTSLQFQPNQFASIPTPLISVYCISANYHSYDIKVYNISTSQITLQATVSPQIIIQTLKIQLLISQTVTEVLDLNFEDTPFAISFDDPKINQQLSANNTCSSQNSQSNSTDTSNQGNSVTNTTEPQNQTNSTITQPDSTNQITTSLNETSNINTLRNLQDLNLTSENQPTNSSDPSSPTIPSDNSTGNSSDTNNISSSSSSDGIDSNSSLDVPSNSIDSNCLNPVEVEIQNSWLTENWDRWKFSNLSKASTLFQPLQSVESIQVPSASFEKRSSLSFGYLSVFDSIQNAYYFAFNLEHQFLSSIRVQSISLYPFTCPSNCVYCNSQNECQQCLDQDKVLPNCQTCREGYIQDPSTLVCILCVDGCCKKNQNDSLCSFCSDPSLKLEYNCKCSTNQIQLYVAFRQVIELNITLINGGDVNSFNLLGCSSCITNKPTNRTILLQYKEDASTQGQIVGIYSSLMNSLGNIEYEVSVLSPPSYLCYGAIKSEKSFIVSLSQQERNQQQQFNLDHLNNSLSLCSDRKAYNSDSNITMQTPYTLNWQKTYKLKYNANTFSISDTTINTDIFTGKFYLTFTRFSLYGKAPMFNGRCEQFSLVKIAGQKSSQNQMQNLSNNDQYFKLIEKENESVFIGGWFKQAENASQQEFGLLRINSTTTQGQVLLLQVTCNQSQIYLTYQNPPDPIKKQLLFSSQNSLSDQWFYLSLNWVNVNFESTLTFRFESSREILQSLSQTIKTSQFYHGVGDNWQLTPNFEDKQSNITKFNGQIVDLNVYTSFQSSYGQPLPFLMILESVLTSLTFSELIFYYEFTQYDFSQMPFMKDFSSNNNNFIDDSFLQSVEFMTGIKLTSKKAFTFPQKYYQNKISEEYGFSVGFSLLIKQTSNKFEGQILRIGKLQVRLQIFDDILPKLSIPSPKYYYLLLCIEEIQCIKAKNIRIPLNYAYGIILQIRRVYVGLRRVLSISIFGETSSQQGLTFSDPSTTTGFRDFNSYFSNLTIRIGSQNNDFVDPQNCLQIRRFILQSGSVVKSHDLLIQGVSDQQIEAIPQNGIISSNLYRLKLQKCILQLGSNQFSVCVKCQENYENVLGTCISNGECSSYKVVSPFESNSIQSFYFDYSQKRCLPCSSNCGSCIYSSTNCLTCSDGYVDAPKCRQCPYVGSTPTYFNPSSKSCVTECPSEYCTDKSNLICTKCDQPMRTIFEDFSTAADSYRGDTWIIQNQSKDTSITKVIQCYVFNYLLSFFGGAGNLRGNSSMKKQLSQIPLHYSLKYSFLLLVSQHNETILNNPQSLILNSLQLTLDNSNENIVTSANSNFIISTLHSNQKLCSTSDPLSSIYNITFSFLHINAISSLTISFTNLTNPLQFYWGIRLFSIKISQCHFSCFTCSGPLQNQCLSCTQDLIFVSGQCLCISETQYLVKQYSCWQNPCYSCQTCTSPCSICDYEGVCLQCISPLFLYKGQCYSDCSYASTTESLQGDNSKGLCLPFQLTEKISELKLLSPFAEFQYAKQWVSSSTSPPLLFQCGNSPFMGPLQQTNISKKFTLAQPVYQVQFSVEVLLLNDWSYSSIQILLNSFTIVNSSFSTFNSLPSISTCITPAHVTTLNSSSVPVDSNSFEISFQSQNITSPVSWAIRKIEIIASVCPLYCKSCITANQCTSCVEGAIFDSSKFTCKCPSGFIYGIDWLCNIQPCGKCIPCHNTCLKCSGPGPFKCSICQKGYKRLGVRCVFECPDNYYEDILSNSCIQCDSSCYSCIGPSETQCKSCYAPQVLTNNQCKDKCLTLEQYSDTFSRVCEYPLDQQNYFYFNSTKDFQSQINEFVSSADFKNPQSKQFSCPNEQVPFLGEQKSFITFNLTNVQKHSSLLVSADIFASSSSYIGFSSDLNFLNFSSKYSFNPPQTSSTCKFQKLSAIIPSYSQIFLSSVSLTITSSSSSFAIRNLNITTVICHASCLTCFGPNINQCASCAEGATLTSDNSCSCTKLDTFLIYISGSQSRPIRSQCSKCMYPCTSCFSYDNFSCQSCEQGFFLKDFSCVSSCPPLKYQKLDDLGICQKCTAPCDECTSDGSQCITCLSGYVLSTKNACVLQCDQMQFYDENNVCQQCHPSCSSCTGFSEQDCTSCASGYFKESQTVLCLQCHDLCVECEDETNLNCPLCQFGIISVNNSICTADCSEIPGTYPDNNQCKSCHPLCNKCDGPNFKNCLQCHDGFALVNSECLLCDSKCINCFGNTSESCTSCAQGYYLENTSCVSQCGAGTFGDNSQCVTCNNSCSICYGPSNNQCFSCNEGYYFSSNSCLACNSLCKSCFGPSSNQCFQCNLNSYLLDTECFSQIGGCPKGYFGDNNTRKCGQCDSSCIKCEGSSQFLCLSCEQGRYLSRVSYDINNKLQPSSCSKCPNTCQSCLDFQNCVSCLNGFYLNNGSCLSQCPRSTYANIQNGNCSRCPIQCTECQQQQDASQNNQSSAALTPSQRIACLACSDGFYLSNNFSCLNCSSNCILCNSATICVKCFSGYYNYKNSCVKQCPISYYPSSVQACVKCIQPCTSCQSPTLCSSCQKGYYLFSQYSSGSDFKIIQSSTCKKCHPVCENCIGESSLDCLTCKFPLFLQDGICQQQCRMGYYGDAGICYSCPAICTSCTSDSVCSSCVERYVNIRGQCLPCNYKCMSCFGFSDEECSQCLSPYSLFQSSCVLNCPTSFFKITTNFSGNQCQSCDISCLNCKGSSNHQCTECRPSFYLSSTGECLPCSQTCLHCISSADTCTSCSLGRFLLDSSCLTKCPDTFYGDEQENACLSCVSPCLTCSGNSKNQCNTCVEEYFYESGVCSECHEDCLSCFGSLSSECTSCQPGVQKKGNSCISCGSGMYFDNNQSSCLTCNSSCKNCYGGSVQSCLSCNAGRYLNFGQCKICPSSCSECSNENQCLSCVNGYYLLKVSGSLSLCLPSCPIGMIASLITQQCSCSFGCATCSVANNLGDTSYSSSQFKVTCSKCISSTYSLNRLDPNELFSCILNSECPYYVNTLSLECIQQCPLSVPFINDISKQCFSGPCPSTTVVYFSSSQQQTCLVQCPSKFYSNSQNICQACHSLCSSCTGQQANNCSSCLDSSVLFHPAITTCALTCETGFTYQQSTNTCEICFEFCKVCVPWLVYLGGTCIEECPVGYQQTGSRKCFQSSSEIVKIITKLDQTVRINKDIVLEASVFSQGSIQSVEWILKKSSDSEFTKAFELLNISQLSLTIPFLILKPSQTYQIRIEVTLASRDILNTEVTFATAGQISQGNFAVSPSSGEAGTTIYNLNLEKWKYPNQIFFDISYYILELQYQVIQAEDGSLQKQSTPDFVKKGLVQIVSQKLIDQTKMNSISFIFPMNFISDTNIAFELKVYDSEGIVESYSYSMVTVSKSKSQYNSEIEVNQDSDLLNVLGNLKSLYYIDETKLLALQQSQSQNMQIAISAKKKYSSNAQCDSSIDCFSSGTCLLTQGVYSCSCTKGFLGKHCEWMESDFMFLSSIISKIEKQLVLSSNSINPVKVAQIINSLMFYNTFLSEVNAMCQLYLSVVTSAIENSVIPLDQVRIQIYSSSAQKLAVTLQQEQNQASLAYLQNLISEINDITSKNINMGEMLTQSSSTADTIAKPISVQNLSDSQLFASPSSRRRRNRRLQSFKRILVSSSSKKAIPIVFGELTVDIPPEVINTSKKVVVSGTSFKKDPRSNPLAITSTLSLSLGGDSGKQSVQDAPKPFILTIPKKVPSPPSSNPNSVQCTYYDESTNSYKVFIITEKMILKIFQFQSDGCSFVKETITNIICSCTHLTDFSAALLPELIKTAISLSDMKAAQAQGNQLLAQRAPKSIQITSLPTPKIGQRNVNLVNAINIQISGGIYNVLAKQVYIVHQDGEDTKTFSMWQFLEEESLEGLIAKAQKEKVEMNEASIDTIQVGQYLIISFSLFFLLFKIGNRASIKFEFLDEKEALPDGLLNDLQNQDNEQKQQNNHIDEEQGETYKKEGIKVERNDNEYENSLAVMTQKRRNKNQVESPLQEETKSSGKKNVITQSKQTKKKVDTLKKKYEQEKKIQELLVKAKTIQDQDDEETASNRKKSVESPANSRLQQSRKSTKTFKKTIFQKINLDSEENQNELDSPKHEEVNTDRVMTTEADDNSTLIKFTQMQTEEDSQVITTPKEKVERSSSRSSSQKYPNNNLKQFETNLPSRFKQAAATPIHANSQFERSSLMKIKTTFTTQMSKAGDSPTKSKSSLQIIDRQKSRLAFSSSKSKEKSESEDVEQQLAVLRMRENIDKEDQKITSKNINPLYSIFKAKETLFQTKASRMIYLFLTCYGYLAFDCLLYKEIGKIAPNQAFINYLFTYNPIRIALITILSNFSSHLFLGFINHSFSKFIQQLQYQEITIQLLNKLRANHMISFLSVFSVIYAIYSIQIYNYAQTPYFTFEQIQEMLLETLAAQILDSLILDIFLVFFHIVFIDMLSDDVPLKISFEIFQSQRGFFYTKKTEHSRVLDLIL